MLSLEGVCPGIPKYILGYNNVPYLVSYLDMCSQDYAYMFLKFVLI